VIDLGKHHWHTDYLPVIPISSDAKTLVRYDKGATVYRVLIQPDGVTLKPTGAIINFGNSCVTAVSHDGTLLAVYNATDRPNRLLAVYDAVTGALKYGLHLRNISWGTNFVNSLCFFPDGKTLAVGGWLDSVRLFDLETQRERGWMTAPRVRGLAISGDGKTLAAGFRDEPSLRVWDIAGLQ
jgi:WD40 repeat protein